MIKLRLYTSEDAPHLFEAACESRGPGFTEWMPWCHDNYTLEESVEFVGAREAAWEKGEDFAFALVDESTGEYLGGAGINQIQRQHAFANLGYWVRRSQWGKGFAVAAVREVARFAFDQLHLVRVEIVIAVGNTKSVRVAEKAGAVHEGVLRNRLQIAGTFMDAHMFSLISSAHPQPSNQEIRDTRVNCIPSLHGRDRIAPGG